MEVVLGLWKSIGQMMSGQIGFSLSQHVKTISVFCKKGQPPLQRHMKKFLHPVSLSWYPQRAHQQLHIGRLPYHLPMSMKRKSDFFFQLGGDSRIEITTEPHLVIVSCIAFGAHWSQLGSTLWSGFPQTLSPLSRKPASRMLCSQNIRCKCKVMICHDLS